MVTITDATKTASNLFITNLLATNNYQKITYHVYGLIDQKFILEISNIKDRAAYLAPILITTEPLAPYELIAYRVSDDMNDLSVVVIQNFKNEINKNCVLSKRNSLQFDLHDIGIERYELDSTYKTLKIFRNKIDQYQTADTELTKSP